MSAADKYAALIALATRKGYDVRVSDDLVDFEKDGLVYYIRVNDGGRDQARLYERATGVDERTSLSEIRNVLESVWVAPECLGSAGTLATPDGERHRINTYTDGYRVETLYPDVVFDGLAALFRRVGVDHPGTYRIA